MQSSNIPTKIPLPFAYAAGGSYINTIPVTSQIGVTDGKASLEDGFPPLTFTPIGTGGVPPFGSDVNGILNEITAITQWQQAGGFFYYDSAFSTTIGGYPKGAILASTSFNGLWISSAENNTTDPDANGAGWISLTFEGMESVAMTSTSVTLTTLQAAYPVLKVTGVLTANSTIIVPNQISEWIVSNQTTGSYTLTVKTSAGTGVNVTQSSSQILWSDATNVYYANASSVTSFNTRTGAITLNSLDVTTALGFTPYNATNPAGYTTLAIALAAAYPIGSIYTSTVSTSPATLFGFGTWVAFGAGRVLIGNGGGFSAGATGGSADAVVVSHTHTASSNSTSGSTSTSVSTPTVTDPGHRHELLAGGSNGTTQVGRSNTSTATSVYSQYATTGISVSVATSTSTLTSTSTTTTVAAAGVSGTNANLQPYIVVYMWNRTA
jgi:hypothetical protein